MNNEEMFQKLLEEIGSINSRLARVENKQDEQRDILQAIRNKQEHTNAELEGLKTTTATAASVKEIRDFQQTSILETIEYIHDRMVTKEDLSASMNVMNEDLFNQKVELHKLKLVK